MQAINMLSYMLSHMRKPAVMAAFVMLSACAHGDVKAPCSDTDAPSSLSSYMQGEDIRPPKPFSTLADHCGPLRPLNVED